MRKWDYLLIGILLLVLILLGACSLINENSQQAPVDMAGAAIPLPTPRQEGQVSLEQALLIRRSIREYTDESLKLDEVSQLLWAAQGITDDGGHRTAPSAGALYPLEIYLLAGNIDGLNAGVYRYLPSSHNLLLVASGDRRTDLHSAALGQEPVKAAPAVIVFAAVYERTERKYGDRAPQYVHIEVGSAAQNVYLQATALDLGTVFIGAFYDEQVKDAIGLAGDEEPLGLMPVGRVRRGK